MVSSIVDGTDHRPRLLPRGWRRNEWNKRVAASAVVLTMSISGPLDAHVAVAAATPAQDAVELEVEIDRRILDADDLSSWVNDEGHGVLTRLDDRDRHGVIRVAIAGELYDYEVVVTARREDAPVGEPSVWTCECSNDELLARLEGELTAAADRLVVERAPIAPVVVAPRLERTQAPDRVDRPRARRLGGVGGAGVALLAAGGAGLAAGLALVIVRAEPPAKPGEVLESRDLETPGTYIAVGSVAAVLLGSTLLALRKRLGNSRRASNSALGSHWFGPARRF